MNIRKAAILFTLVGGMTLGFSVPGHAHNIVQTPGVTFVYSNGGIYAGYTSGYAYRGYYNQYCPPKVYRYRDNHYRHHNRHHRRDHHEYRGYRGRSYRY